MATTPDAVRSPADDDAPDGLEWLHVTPSDYGEVTVEESEEGRPRVTVPISSTTPHRSDGKVMTEEALEGMAEQLQSGEVGLWDDHGLSPLTGWREYRREEMYGKWVDGEVVDEVLWGTAELMESREQTTTLLEQLDQDMPVGFSVGYKPEEEEMLATDGESDEKTRHIFAVDLWETSPVGIPDNPEAIAAVAAELDRADVDVDADLASTVAASVREGLETAHMSETPDDDSTDSGDAPDEGADAGTDPDGGIETRDLDAEQVDEVMTVVNSVFAAAEDAIRSELAEGDDDDEDEEEDDDDEEESADAGLDVNGGDPDDAEDVDDLVDRLDALEERNQELEERLDEKEATIDRLESESRESAGRKGISPSAGTDGVEDVDPDDPDSDTESTSNRPADTLAEARRLGGS